MTKASVLLAVAMIFIVNALDKSNAAESAEFGLVKKGVFKMKEGETIDLTERGILFKLHRVKGRAGEQADSVDLGVIGGSTQYGTGSRIDLKKHRSTEVLLKDVGVCFLDVLAAAIPQGAPPYATFRLMCE